MPKPVIYTKVKVIKITETQHCTLLKLKDRKVNVANFIRQAIAEKIQREAQDLIVKPKKEFIPF